MARRVVIFSLAYLPFVGGAELAVKEITDRLDDEFELVTVNLDGRQSSVEKIGRVVVYRLGRGWWSKYLFPLLAYHWAVRRHKKHSYDTVWAIMANQAGLAALLFKWRFPATHFLLTLQEGDSSWDIWWRTWFIRPLYHAIYRQADAIQAISNFLAARAIRLGARRGVTVVPNGVDLKLFAAAGHGYSFSHSTSRVIVTTSRLVKKNGLRDLIHALKFLPPDVTLDLIGRGPEEEALRRHARRWRVSERVSFVGELPARDLPSALGRAKIFARPSLSEGLGSSFLEAMAFGLPVIATPVGGIPDFLIDGETGWFVPPRDPRGIADRVRYLLEPANYSKVETVIDRARNLVVERYDWDKVAPRIGQMLS
ncbi:MAG: glycosyltransferase [Patescibacteria group bacterium]